MAKDCLVKPSPILINRSIATETTCLVLENVCVCVVHTSLVNYGWNSLIRSFDKIVQFAEM